MGSKRVSIEQLKARIFNIHGNTVTIVEETYVGMKEKAKFGHVLYGEWLAKPEKIVGGQSHPDGKKAKRKQTLWIRHGVTKIADIPGLKDRRKQTCIEVYGGASPYNSALVREKGKQTNMARYGVENPNQNPAIALKVAKSAKKTVSKYHWKTGEELICQASYEAKTVDYLNQHNIDFLWQPEAFKMPNGKTYRPDLYISDSGTWVEIKGYMRPIGLAKWDWFLTQFPTAELWNEPKLKEMGIL